jgi:membrane-bound ClpP family serine protease
MLPLVLYLLVGFLVCLCAASDRKRPYRAGRSSLWLIFDPVWPIAFLWPVFLAIAYLDDRHSTPTQPASPALSEHIGVAAIVVATLRPTSRIQIGNVQHDARSVSGIVPEGSQVRIVGKSMAEFLVERIPDKRTAENSGPSPLRV